LVRRMDATVRMPSRSSEAYLCVGCSDDSARACATTTFGQTPRADTDTNPDTGVRRRRRPGV
jgi:hypothetical protein